MQREAYLAALTAESEAAAEEAKAAAAAAAAATDDDSDGDDGDGDGSAKNDDDAAAADNAEPAKVDKTSSAWLRKRFRAVPLELQAMFARLKHANVVSGDLHSPRRVTFASPKPPLNHATTAV